MKKFLTALLVVLMSAILFAPQAMATSHRALDIICRNNPNAQECLDAGDNSAGTFTNFATNVIDVLSYIIGVASVIVLIVAGLMYVFSSGNPDNTARARSAIIYAAVGIVVAVAAQAIVRFVIGAV